MQELSGNTDRDTVVYHKLNPSITARYIRFRPVAWHRHISMRMEIYGCEGNHAWKIIQDIYIKQVFKE